MEYKAHPYQDHATKHIVDFNACGLFMEMGLGKTVASLTAIDQLIYERFEVSRVLVIAPKFVALNVWKQEVEKWDHLKHLRVSIITGDAGARTRALRAPADIYVINRENVTWLVTHFQTKWPFDMVVVDELSSFKDPQSQRFKSMRIIRGKVRRLVGLTGTPAPNGLTDLWSQIYLMDQGARLGATLTAFREAFLVRKENGFGYRVRKGSEQEIYDRIADICVSMKTTDYLQLPERIEIDRVIQLDPKLQDQYNAFEKEAVLEMADGEEITAINAGVLVNKLLQFSNGAIYNREREVQHLHDVKLDALEEIIESAGGQQVLIFYSFLHDRDRLLQRFKNARQLRNTKDIEEWNAGKVGIMICHPASAGHGLNLQAGGNIAVWFGITWSLEQYQQANARLHRQGQIKPVTIYRLLCTDTMDSQVTETLQNKDVGQASLMAAVKARIDFYSKKH